MKKVNVYNLAGKKVEEISLDEAVFSAKKNDTLLHQVYVALLSNARQVLAHTKNRGDRAGSGKKPWQQKGTGRARVGSVRNPAWKKGGVVFGPRNDRNFSQKINRKMNLGAMVAALSGKVRDEELVVLDDLALTEVKTQKIAGALKALKIKSSVLFAFGEEETKTYRAVRNIPKVSGLSVKQLNVKEILDHKYLICSKASIDFLTKKYNK